MLQAVKEKEQFERFMTGKEICESGLFPGLNEWKLNHYVRRGWVRSHGPMSGAIGRHYLLSEVYEDWKKMGENLGTSQIQKRPQKLAGGLPKAWRSI